MSATNTERPIAAPGLRIRTKSGEVLDLAEIRRRFVPASQNESISHADTVLPLLDSLEAALSVPTEPYNVGRRGDVVSGANDMRGRIHRAAGVVEDDAPEFPEWLTRDQALSAARHAFPEHGELRVVSYEAGTCGDKPLWYIVVSNGERETSVAFPRALEEQP